MENNNNKISSTPRRRRYGKNKPNIVHPTIPGAVGSHESPYQEGRDSISDSKLIIDDVIKNIRGESS
jgi:hypothetical protein